MGIGLSSPSQLTAVRQMLSNHCCFIFLSVQLIFCVSKKLLTYEYLVRALSEIIV